MKLINKRNNNILAENLNAANNPFSRMKGLLGRKSLPQGEGLHITPCNSIHSFFMQFDFDAVFIDKKNIVKKLGENLPPWKVVMTCLSAHSVIELPAGVIKASETQLEDELEFC